jgi:PAS domain-containing protein
LSDKAKAVESMFHDRDIMIRASILKVWFYVGTTGLLLYFLVARLLDRLNGSHQREMDNLREKQRAHDLLAAIADNSEHAIFAKDPRGRHLLSNPAASRFVG